MREAIFRIDRELADNWIVFDTSGNHPVIIAKTEE